MQPKTQTLCLATTLFWAISGPGVAHSKTVESHQSFLSCFSQANCSSTHSVHRPLGWTPIPGNSSAFFFHSQTHTKKKHDSMMSTLRWHHTNVEVKPCTFPDADSLHLCEGARVLGKLSAIRYSATFLLAENRAFVDSLWHSCPCCRQESHRVLYEYQYQLIATICLTPWWKKH